MVIKMKITDEIVSDLMEHPQLLSNLSFDDREKFRKVVLKELRKYIKDRQ